MTSQAGLYTHATAKQSNTRARANTQYVTIVWRHRREVTISYERDQTRKKLDAEQQL